MRLPGNRMVSLTLCSISQDEEYEIAAELGATHSLLGVLHKTTVAERFQYHLLLM